MQSTLRAVALAATLCACPSPAAAHSEWEAYKPGTLARVASAEFDSLDFGTPDSGRGRVNTSAVNYPQRVTVKYTGEHRPLSLASRMVLRAWGTAIVGDSTLIDRFTNEYRFTENGVDHWIPVQTV